MTLHTFDINFERNIELKFSGLVGFLLLYATIERKTAFRAHVLCYRLMTVMSILKKSLLKLYTQLFQKLMQLQDFSLFSCVMPLYGC